MKHTNKIVHICIICAVLLSAAAVYADSASDVRIDYKMDLAQEAYASNYFSWTVGKKAPVKDAFDAATGASLKGSTSAFNEVRYSEPAADKKAAIPAGLRGLFLYPISNRQTAEFDNLHATTEGGVITVRFVHRGTAYELKTDAKGNFNLLTGAKFAKNIADNNMNVFTVKQEYLKEGGDPAKMSDVDWSKFTLTPDTYASDAAYHYEGNLKFTLKNNVLSISGTMKKK